MLAFPEMFKHLVNTAECKCFLTYHKLLLQTDSKDYLLGSLYVSFWFLLYVLASFLCDIPLASGQLK